MRKFSKKTSVYSRKIILLTNKPGKIIIQKNYIFNGAMNTIIMIYIIISIIIIIFPIRGLVVE